MSGIIYHYTSIETLKLILENNTLRLNNLNNADDLEDSNINYFKNLRKCIFISSWTKEKRENIVLWSMYTKAMRGVRIGIDYSNIKLIKTNENNIANIENSEHILAFQNGDFFIDVKYVNNSSMIDIISEGNINRESMKELGTLKKEEWSSQMESRFLLLAIPRDKNIFASIFPLEISFFESILHNDNLVDTVSKDNFLDHIDIILEDSFWNNAEILMGPGTTDKDLIEVKKLLQKYKENNNIQTKKSSLKINTDRYKRD
ncbi:DUF2971 domain-containing protein [Paenibacillus sp. PsM32]|uniref:DUF2971 domain-containing protein n=1 Tax=Paenibacillus sp. PsM32 TaxID=3030536 RepID=UPI00263BA72F|nr:DUF2971 domain-containing protein [Paenibacillus sp. PsM32]MDN4619309.1 DUF2971 domain-containing protein [Paenibacillus sp. PsM32]